MPSTKKQKAKSRKSREKNILSEYGYMDIMLREGNASSIERELDSIINGPEGQPDTQSLLIRENSSQENEVIDIDNSNGPVRQEGLSESINILNMLSINMTK